MSNEVLKLRIVADTEEDIFADVLLDTSCHLLSLHQFILDLFKLDQLEMASFYLSNDEWDKGEEITLFDMSLEEDEFSPMSMESTSIFQIHEKTNKILYVHDFLNMNIFYVEILDLLPSNQNHAGRPRSGKSPSLQCPLCQSTCEQALRSRSYGAVARSWSD